MGRKEVLKGNELEDVLLLLEKIGYKLNRDFNFEDIEFCPKQIILENDVKYEIDLMVIIHQGENTETIIFECKNWDSKKIDVKEIVHFDEKVQITKAKKGYLVGTDITKYALNRIKLNKKLIFLKVNKDLVIFEKISPIRSIVIYPPKKVESIDFLFKSKINPLNGKTFETIGINRDKEKFNQEIYGFVIEDYNKITSDLNFKDSDFIEYKRFFSLIPNKKLIVENKEVKSLKIYYKFYTKSEYKNARIRYDIKNKGFVLIYEPLEIFNAGDLFELKLIGNDKKYFGASFAKKGD